MEDKGRKYEQEIKYVEEENINHNEEYENKVQAIKRRRNN